MSAPFRPVRNASAATFECHGCRGVTDAALYRQRGGLGIVVPLTNLWLASTHSQYALICPECGAETLVDKHLGKLLRRRPLQDGEAFTPTDRPAVFHGVGRSEGPPP